MAELAISAVALALTIFDKVLALTKRYNHGFAKDLLVDVERAKNWWSIMEASLKDSEKQIDGGSNLLQQRVKQVENIAYDVEDALSEFVLLIHGKRRLSQKMHDIATFQNKIKKASRKLSTKMVHIMKNKECYDKLEELLQQSFSSTMKEDWLEQVLEKGDEIVGFEKRNEDLIKQLMKTDQSHLILIAGPGGSGKSTMVKNVYGSKGISEKKGFKFQAWVHVPNMEPEKVLQKILEQFEAQRQKVLDEENDIEGKQKERFLVVLDNVWSKNDLDYIVKSLSRDLPGSKIIITTRHCDITSLSPDSIHDLSSGLSSGKAKDLFCKKAFPKSPENWPPIVEKWAQRILNMCEGMPHSISVIGTFLAKQPHIPVEWKKVHDKLGSEICNDCSDLYVISRNLQPSYKDLPSNLKNCFLYFSMFPQDYSISRERLIRLWVAEGFVMSEEGQPEGKAADLLNELVKRNLVVASAREVDGRQIRKCRVLHLVREINILRRKNFSTVLEKNYNPSADRIRRLSINNGSIKSIKGMTASIRTLLVFGLADPHSELEMILKTSKFLRVLDLQGVDLEKFPDHVVGLTLLKYLSLKKTRIKTVPKSIKNLVDLETLDLRHTGVSRLPNKICKLEKLRHLLVFCNDVGSSGGVELSVGNLGDLSSMQELLWIKVESNRGILAALGELTDLRKLGLTDLINEDGRKLCESIQKMTFLSTLEVRATSENMYLDLDHMKYPLVAPQHLQRLYMEGQLQRVPTWIPELASLTKIGLKWSKLTPANPLEPLQDLPNLIELDLVDYYTGDQLVFGDNTFQKLMILCMEQFDQLKSMTIIKGAMPQLKKLAMRKCKNLKTLPDGVGHLDSLDEFKWNDMPDEFIAGLQSYGQKFPRVGIIHS